MHFTPTIYIINEIQIQIFKFVFPNKALRNRIKPADNDSMDDLSEGIWAIKITVISTSPLALSPLYTHIWVTKSKNNVPYRTDHYRLFNTRNNSMG